ncbi:hypothetical protein [Olleya namhaensis]|uniref:hypothetical protein n=1 Tax=Olleya namhaensis TaxID=1144750 RepID=UPI00232DCBB7|nr:hypothetical protein [Olleya namhaensis]
MPVKTINPKQKLLLGAGFDVLHFENKEWLSTIRFWKDEVKFFDNLLNKKGILETNKQDYLKMLKSLDKIHTDLFEDIEDDIIAHEKLLSRIEKAEKGLSDNLYREEHQKILNRIETFKTDFSQFKKIVFDFTKNI